MSNWRPTFCPEHLYFVTTKAAQYAHVFRRDIIKRLLLDTLDCMRHQGRFRLFSFVIMPNHVHFIIQSPAEHTIADAIRDFKHTTSDRLVRQLEAESNSSALAFLALNVTRPSRQHHRVWEEGYNAKDVFSPDFLREKMAYIHNNPCQPHWNLSETPEAYIWSSARFYLSDARCIIPVDDARDLL
ncbi:MAG: transposase [Anaerolineae bacterium]